MFSWKEFENYKSIFSQMGSSSYQDVIGQHHVKIRPVDLLRWIELARIDLGFLTLVDIFGIDNFERENKNKYQFELIYQLLNMGTHQRLNIHVHFNQEEVIPSIVKEYAHADWMEREQSEALGLSFSSRKGSLLLPEGQTVFPLRKKMGNKSWPEDKPGKLPLLRKNPNKSEAPYPEESWEWKRFNILSPTTLGLFELWLCFNPERVVDSQIHIGFHHQGLEKLLESKDWLQSLQLVDKLHLGAAPTYSIAWAKNLEELLQIKLPERAQAIRIVMLELARIAEHLTVMHEMTWALSMDEHRLFIDSREKIYELIEKYCGHRQGIGLTRIGGMKDDLPHGWIVEYQSIFELLTKNLRIIHKSLISQIKFREVLSGSSVNAQTVLQWGVSGPAMRASGLNFDLRKSQPFYFYQDIDFDIPVGIHGTAYDRYLIRYEEIFQSFRIITQVIDNLPLGEILSSEFDKDYFSLKSLLISKERHFGSHYSCLESPNGEAGFSLILNSDLIPYRVKMKTPSFPLAQAMPQFIMGVRPEELRACLASLGIRRFEMDR